MSAVTPPSNQRYIGHVEIAGKRYQVQPDEAWRRYWVNDVYQRIGGALGPSTSEAAAEAGGNGGTEELRAQLAETRADLEQFLLHSRIAALEERVLALTDALAFIEQGPSL